MKKILIFVSVLSMVLSAARVAGADAVYLKNGRVMKGRIIEKNEQFLVLKSGEDESAVKTTIFLEDINRIETEEQYSKEAPPIPFLSGREPFSLQKPPEMALPQNISLATPQQYTFPAIGSGETQEGSISGFVGLPENFKEHNGDLYVYLMEDIGRGRFASSPFMLYTRISASEIISRLVPYKMEHVPVATYKIFAQWDIAPPFIQELSEGQRRTLTSLGTQGDYEGSLADAFVLAAGEDKENVGISCTTFLQTSKAVAMESPKPDFQIEDLYYRKASLSEPEFFILIKNKGETAISWLAFDIFINDEKVSSGPMGLGSLKSGEEKEFDITLAYQSYQKIMKEKQANKEVPEELPTEGIKQVKFKIVWPQTQEVEFEKTLFML